MGDTTREAAKVQAGVQEQLGGAARLRLAYEMSAAARALALAGLRARRPTWTVEELSRALHLPPDRLASSGSPPRTA